MKSIGVAITALALSAACQQPKPLAPTGREIPPPGLEPSRQTIAAGDGVSMCSTSNVSATLRVGGTETRVTGRTSFYLTASADQVNEGSINAVGFNVVFFVVPQQPIAGDRKVDVEEGSVGFAFPTTPVQKLAYDRKSGTIRGEIRGFVDAAYMSKLTRRERGGKEDDVVETATQPATLSVTLQLPRPIDPSSKDVQTVDGTLDAKIRVEKFDADGFTMPPFEIELRPEMKLPIDIGHLFFEVGRALCVQPVRLARIRFFLTHFGIPMIRIDLTGEGLAFGQPGANTQWRKADIRFIYREWKTLFRPAFFVLETDAEEDDLRALVQDGDCVEVFFIDDFDPEAKHGGGATFGLGIANTQIISSDANARGGIDLTHLAHELGHSLGLHHPGTSPTPPVQPGSTGTLMCPSGFLNDNPKRNSQENADNVFNPLLIFTFLGGIGSPDCEDSSDCGPCP